MNGLLERTIATLRAAEPWQRELGPDGEPLNVTPLGDGRALARGKVRRRRADGTVYTKPTIAARKRRRRGR